ncbi:hypothetical protein BEWA_047690 [Theileria equi strain WA]|uniref:Signal peptide containing protein n=1 Tax=Theileria equi strain WA TaxID=1537102 RepID=L1LAN3_THEEQ|nr:hypothetical protein BEWA_047690 [Theileria equi strain WA]EKX72304.1 hypothetical protein BEWA_047690 [Theileria equi strain WA]|eukprot:XP_004831756.1 hypothetical protein BEWA_047690 [Theileria equi strain WA]
MDYKLLPGILATIAFMRVSVAAPDPALVQQLEALKGELEVISRGVEKAKNDRSEMLEKANAADAYAKRFASSSAPLEPDVTQIETIKTEITTAFDDEKVRIMELATAISDSIAEIDTFLAGDASDDEANAKIASVTTARDQHQTASDDLANTYTNIEARFALLVASKAMVQNAIVGEFWKNASNVPGSENLPLYDTFRTEDVKTITISRIIEVSRTYHGVVRGFCQEFDVLKDNLTAKVEDARKLCAEFGTLVAQNPTSEAHKRANEDVAAIKKKLDDVVGPAMAHIDAKKTLVEEDLAVIADCRDVLEGLADNNALDGDVNSKCVKYFAKTVKDENDARKDIADVRTDAVKRVDDFLVEIRRVVDRLKTQPRKSDNKEPQADLRGKEDANGMEGLGFKYAILFASLLVMF